MAKVLIPHGDVIVDEDLTMYSVEVVVFKITVPAGKSPDEAIEYEMADTTVLAVYDDYGEAANHQWATLQAG